MSRKSEFDPRLEQRSLLLVGKPEVSLGLCGEIGYRVGLLIPRLRVRPPPESRASVSELVKEADLRSAARMSAWVRAPSDAF